MSKSKILWFCFLVAALARCFTALKTIEILHPDEHFQTLEPAYHLVTGGGWLSWEWNDKLRSWVIPYFYAGILWISQWTLSAQDPHTGFTAILFCRFVTALFSIAALYQLWSSSQKLKISNLGQLLLLAGLGFSVPWITLAPSTLSDTLAMAAIGIFYPFALQLWSKRPMISALLILAPAFLRMQTLALSLPTMLTLLLLTPFEFRQSQSEKSGTAGIWNFRLKSAGLCFGAFILTVLIQGAFDWITWGEFLISSRTNLRKNFFENVASFYGVHPWHEYASHFVEWYGWETTALIAGAVVLTLFRCFNSRAAEGVKIPVWVTAWTIGSVIYVLVHSMIAHKEARFLFPALPGLVLGALVILDRGLGLGRGLASLMKQANEVPGQRTLLLGLILLFGTNAVIRAPHHSNYPSSNMSSLMITLQKEEALSKSPKLLLLGHNWVWTHGELLQWTKFEVKELAVEKLTEAELLPYSFMVVIPQQEEKFKTLSNGRHKLVLRDPRGYALYQKIS